MAIFKRIAGLWVFRAAPWVLVTALACAGPVLAADATVDQVYQAANSGHLDQAQQLMNQVLRDHPNSAKAHYVEAEISARAANFPRAREELAKAQQLDPSGSFAKPESVARLQRELARGSVYSAPTQYRPYVRQQERHFSFWPILLLIGAGVVIVWALAARRNSQPQYYPGGVPPTGPVGGGYGGPAGYGPAGYGPPMGGGGLGSGIVGGLASGLALGAGVAAGEELVHHWIDRDGNRVEGSPPPGYVPPPQDDNANMGGNDFGVSDSGSWDDNSGGSFGGDSGGGGGDDWT
jgi:uncharacterized protein